MLSMPSDRIDGTLRDILHHVDLATEDVTAHLVWETVRQALPALRVAVTQEIARLQD